MVNVGWTVNYTARDLPKCLDVKNNIRCDVCGSASCKYSIPRGIEIMYKKHINIFQVELVKAKQIKQ